MSCYEQKNLNLIINGYVREITNIFTPKDVIGLIYEFYNRYTYFNVIPSKIDYGHKIPKDIQYRYLSMNNDCYLGLNHENKFCFTLTRKFWTKIKRYCIF